MPQSKGYRVKTRRLLTRKGNPGFSDKLLKLRELKPGDKVLIYIDPRFHKGMPHRRYHGKIGIASRASAATLNRLGDPDMEEEVGRKILEQKPISIPELKEELENLGDIDYELFAVPKRVKS